MEGPQVGDLNLWSTNDLSERFYSGKTRALHGTHLSTGDRMWSGFPHMRAMSTITYDTLDWYGFDADGGSVHDVIGTRCDPYTGRLLSGQDYHHCCHSNLTRALAAATGLSPAALAAPAQEERAPVAVKQWAVAGRAAVQRAERRAEELVVAVARPGDRCRFQAGLPEVQRWWAGVSLRPRQPGRLPVPRRSST